MTEDLKGISPVPQISGVASGPLFVPLDLSLSVCDVGAGPDRQPSFLDPTIYKIHDLSMEQYTFMESHSFIEEDLVTVTASTSNCFLFLCVSKR